jgi:hypothetical protein
VTREFELPEESLVSSLGRGSSSEDIKVMVGMREKLIVNFKKNG